MTKLATEQLRLTTAVMDVLGRYRNLIVLVGVLFAQVLGLAVQVKRTTDERTDAPDPHLGGWSGHSSRKSAGMGANLHGQHLAQLLLSARSARREPQPQGAD
jgi:hypothetical protein